jgi:hypothetical protein
MEDLAYVPLSVSVIIISVVECDARLDQHMTQMHEGADGAASNNWSVSKVHYQSTHLLTGCGPLPFHTPTYTHTLSLSYDFSRQHRERGRLSSSYMTCKEREQAPTTKSGTCYDIPFYCGHNCIDHKPRTFPLCSSRLVSAREGSPLGPESG